MKNSTDYAIRCLIYLSAKKNGASLSEIAKGTAIETSNIGKVLLPLTRAKLIRSTPRSENAFDLMRKPKQITLYEVIQVMEGTCKLHPSLEQSAYYEGCVIDVAALKKVLADFQRKNESYLQSITIADLVSKSA